MASFYTFPLIITHKIQQHTNEVATAPTEQKNIHHLTVCTCYNDQSSHCSDSLSAGRSGDRNRVGARFFTHVIPGPGALPDYYKTGIGSFRRLNWLRLSVDHPHTPSAEIKGRVQIYLYPAVGFRGQL